MTEVYAYFSLLHILWLSLGGAFGAALRYCVTVALLPYQQAWPWATWLVNLVGAAILGFIAAYFNDLGYSPGFLFWEVGVLGGFTTMSTFGLEAFTLFKARRAVLALAYILSSALGGVAAIVLGFTLGGLLS